MFIRNLYITFTLANIPHILLWYIFIFLFLHSFVPSFFLSVILILSFVLASINPSAHKDWSPIPMYRLYSYGNTTTFHYYMYYFTTVMIFLIYRCKQSFCLRPRLKTYFNRTQNGVSKIFLFDNHPLIWHPFCI